MLADATKETEQLKQEQQAFNEVVSAISQRVGRDHLHFLSPSRSSSLSLSLVRTGA